MNYIPRRPIHAAVDVPPCRMVELHLLTPSRRATHPLGPCWGGVLLLERHQAAPVRKALQEVARAWPGGVRAMNRQTIRLPLAELTDLQIRRFGDDYADGFALRVGASEPPPVFDMRDGGAAFTRPVPAGSVIQCALSLFATLSHDGQPSIGTEIEWLNLIELETQSMRWQQGSGIYA